MVRWPRGRTWLVAILAIGSGCKSVPAPRYAQTDGWAGPIAGPVALLPVDHLVAEPERLPGLGPEHRRRIERILIEQLKASGIDVSASGVGDRWDRSAAEVGGVFDSESGAVDPRRVYAISERVLDNVDARYLVAPQLVFVPVELSGTKIRWDGVVRRYTGVPVGEVRIDGSSRAISLVLSTYERGTGQRFSSRAGLVFPYEYVSSGLRPKSEYRPADVFEREHELTEGVRLALEPLVHRDDES